MAGYNRRFESFVDAFSTFLEKRHAPKEYHLWAGLWCLAAAIERRISTYTRGSDLYPNIFVILLGPPGFGKTTIIKPCRQLVGSLGKDRIAPSSMSFASFADHIKDYQRTIIDPRKQTTITYNCVNICSSEMQVMLPVYDTMLLGKITDIYDCDYYGESRRSAQNNFEVERTCCSMLAGTTPTHLFHTLPEEAWATGFMSRCFVVWASQIELTSLFGDEDAEARDVEFLKLLAQDLKHISELTGRVRFTPEAAAKMDAFGTYGLMGGPPIPRHPRLLNYAARRTGHLIKLCQLSVIDRKDELLIEEYDYDRAYDWLIGMELNLPGVFQAHNSGGDSQITEDLHHEMSRIYIERGGKPLPRRYLVNFLMPRAQAFKHEAIIKAAVGGGWFQEIKDPQFGLLYIPAAESPFIFERKELRPKGA